MYKLVEVLILYMIGRLQWMRVSGNNQWAGVSFIAILFVIVCNNWVGVNVLAFDPSR